MIRITAQRRRGTALEEADLPDTGSPRGDVLAITQRMVRRFQQLTPDLIGGVLTEAADPPPDFLYVTQDAMATILKRGAECGEVRLDAVTPRIARLPTDLVRHELLIRRRPFDDQVLAEIVDDIFLPLVRRAGPLSATPARPSPSAYPGPMTR